MYDLGVGSNLLLIFEKPLKRQAHQIMVIKTGQKSMILLNWEWFFMCRERIIQNKHFENKLVCLACDCELGCEW